MGKKYVIEIIEKPFKDDAGREVWRAKGFNTLYFDQNGLDKLEEYKEPEEETHELKVGDVCYIPEAYDSEKLLVTRVDPYMTTYMRSDGSSYILSTHAFKEKTVFMYHSKIFEAFLAEGFK